MKESIFNSRIRVSNKTDLLYNAYSNRFMLLNKSIALNADKQNSCYELFREGNFIIDEKTDELERVKEMANKVIEDSNNYILIINPTLECCFRCWYCYEEKKQGANMNKSTLNRIFLLLNGLCRKYKALNLSFFGGEPLLRYSGIVVPLINYASDLSKVYNCKLNISFTTNGALLNSQMLEFFQDKNVAFQITVDGSEKLHDKTRFFLNGNGSYHIILHNISSLLRNKHKVVLRINYTDENIDNINDIADDVIKITTSYDRKYLIFSLHQVWQKSNEDLSDKINKELLLLWNKGLSAIKPTFDNIRHPCYADKLNSVVINYNGDLYKCTAVDFVNTQREGYLNEYGQLIWEKSFAEKRLNVRFKNLACLKCRILPICNQACSQKALYSQNQDICIFHYSENDKDNIILDIFQRYINKNGI